MTRNVVIEIRRLQKFSFEEVVSNHGVSLAYKSVTTCHRQPNQASHQTRTERHSRSKLTRVHQHAPEYVRAYATDERGSTFFTDHLPVQHFHVVNIRSGWVEIGEFVLHRVELH
jgi:hypothetical protein